MKNLLIFYIILLVIVACNKKDEEDIDNNSNVPDNAYTEKVVLFRDDFDSNGSWIFKPDSANYIENTAKVEIVGGAMNFIFTANNQNTWGGVGVDNFDIGQNLLPENADNIGVKIKLNYGNFQFMSMEDSINEYDGYIRNHFTIVYGDLGIQVPPFSFNTIYGIFDENIGVLEGNEFDFWIAEDSLVVKIDENVVYNDHLNTNIYASSMSSSTSTMMTILFSNRNPYDFSYKDSLSIDYIEIYTCH